MIALRMILPDAMVLLKLLSVIIFPFTVIFVAADVLMILCVAARIFFVFSLISLLLTDKLLAPLAELVIPRKIPVAAILLLRILLPTKLMLPAAVPELFRIPVHVPEPGRLQF